MRDYLKTGSKIKVPGGVIYRIIGEPIGEGGGSIIYPAIRLLPDGDGYRESHIIYAIKECFPRSDKFLVERNADGEIIALPKEKNTDPADAADFLNRVKEMQKEEEDISGRVYVHAFRITPVIESYQEAWLSMGEGQEFVKVSNMISVMESLSGKGQSLKSILKEKQSLNAYEAFSVIRQVLAAIKEVHTAGFLHLDIQDGNVFLKGVLSEGDSAVSLVDFGSARPICEDGLCSQVSDGILYSTQGFSAPEIILKNDGHLRLGKQADIYSAGCLLLLLLTGHRYTTTELISNQTGKYIPRFAVRKTKCPGHLVDKMQNIMAKALQNDPGERYESAENMIADIDDMLTLLAPHKDPLSAVDYNAFISYRHSEKDSAAARALRNALERYRSGLFGERKIKRVFLDEGELSSCADFGERIHNALERSQWLILICSKKTRESKWVNEEIKTFLKYHDRDHVLALLIEGEPEEAYPDELINNGFLVEKFLAADARADDAGGIVKRIKGDARLRIAAPMLNTTFDALKQRNKLYVMQRSIAAAALILCAMAAFITMLLIKNAQVNARYQESRRNQARYMSTVALDDYAEGKRCDALNAALSVLPDDESDGPLVPEQNYALSTALNAYNDTYAPSAYLSLPVNDSQCFSDDGSYLFSWSEYVLNVYDTGTNENVLSINCEDLLTEHPQLTEHNPYLKSTYGFSRIIPGDGTKFFINFGGSGSVVEMDIADKDYIKDTVIMDGIYSLSKLTYADGKLAAEIGTGYLVVYDTDSGELIFETDFNEDSGDTEYTIKALAFCENGTKLAVGFDYSYAEISSQNFYHTDPELNAEEEEYFLENPADGLILLDLDSGDKETLSVKRTTALSCFENGLLAVHKTYPSNIIKTVNLLSDPAALWTEELFDIQSGSVIYESESVLAESLNSAGFTGGKLAVSGVDHNVYLLWRGKTAAVIDADTDEILYQETFHEDICSMGFRKGALITLVLSEGSVQVISISDDTFMRTTIMDLDTTFEKAVNKGVDFLLLTEEGMITGTKSDWEEDESITTENAALSSCDAKSFSYEDTEDGILRMVKYADQDASAYSDIYTGIEVYKLSDEKPVFSFAVSDPEDAIYDAKISSDGKKITLLMGNSGGSYKISCFSLNDGSKLYETDISGDLEEFTTSFDSEFSENGDMLCLSVYHNLKIYDISQNGEKCFSYESDNMINEHIFTADGSSFLWTEKESGESRMLYMADLKSGEIKKTELPVTTLSYSGCTLLAGEDSTVIIYDGGSKVYFYDTETDTFKEPLEVTQESSISYMKGSNELIAVQGETVSLYDLKSGKLESTLTLPYSPSEIITDAGTERIGAVFSRLYTSANDKGWLLGGIYLISIDENRIMYMEAYVNKSDSWVSPEGGEIVTGSENGTFTVDHIRSFKELHSLASEMLEEETK